MNMDETNRTYRQAAERASERIDKVSKEAVGAFSDSSWNAMRGLQEYNETLLEITQSNVNSTFEFLRQAAAAKSPSELIALAAGHARRQYETSVEQAKELASLGQKFARASAEPVKQYATKSYDEAA